MEFKIGDIVEQNGNPVCRFEVTGVIHDDKRLFVVDYTGKYGNGKEFELSFIEVTKQWHIV